MENNITDNIEDFERAIAVTVGKKGGDKEIIEERLSELEALADTAGADIVEKFYQELEKPNQRTVIGKGKLEEIKLAVLEEDIGLVIFDEDLSPAQARNLENELDVKIVDKSGLILDIFAKQAKTLEAQTQVELAQSIYMLPRLTRMWTHLSKQYGGIGTKGPGETQIETDRRILRDKIRRLRKKLKEIDVQKEQQRKGRGDLARFALVGYTNAGKSTLMNALTDATVGVEDKLFATLDSTVRSFYFPNGQKALLSDTVGFIRDLPAHLIASFKSTLAEARETDVILHVVDVTHRYYKEHVAVVRETLENLKIADKPRVLIMNKIDEIKDVNYIRQAELEFPNAVFVSAKRGTNFNSLLEMMQERYNEQGKVMELALPYTEMDKVNSIYEMGDIQEREDKDDGMYFKVRLNPEKSQLFDHYFSKFKVDGDEDE